MKILKIAKSGNKNFQQWFFVVDNLPELTYEKIGLDFVGSAYTDSGKIIFSEWLKKESWPGAFAGRALTLKMKDGGTETIKDWWYDAGNYPEHGEFASVGMGTLEQLQDCYVYSSYYVSKEAINELVAEYYTRDRDYAYYEVKEWVDLQYQWYPVIVDGKKTSLMVNKKGDFIDCDTLKPIRTIQRNVCIVRHKQKGRTDRCFHLCLFDWTREENGRKIRTQRRMIDVLQASLPACEFTARVEELKRKKLIYWQ